VVKKGVFDGLVGICVPIVSKLGPRLVPLAKKNRSIWGTLKPKLLGSTLSCVINNAITFHDFPEQLIGWKKGRTVTMQNQLAQSANLAMFLKFSFH